MITDDHLAALAPYIAGQPDGRGETPMRCPLHDDVQASASLNIEKGVWYCHAGCGGGSIEHLITGRDLWFPPRTLVGSITAPTVRPARVPSLNQVKIWHRTLMRSRGVLARLRKLRGVEPLIAAKARLGWDRRGGVFKIPVFTPDRKIQNVRTYDPDHGSRRKIWSVRGMGAPYLYPIGVTDRANPSDAIVICEGEWDALRALQAGVLAVTQTGGTSAPWQPQWNPRFAGLRVFVCHDADRPGQEANLKVARQLTGVAASVQVCRLPYRIEPKHGKDLTDLLNENGDQAIWSLMEGAR